MENVNTNRHIYKAKRALFSQQKNWEIQIICEKSQIFLVLKDNSCYFQNCKEFEEIKNLNIKVLPGS